MNRDNLYRNCSALMKIMRRARSRYNLSFTQVEMLLAFGSMNPTEKHTKADMAASMGRADSNDLNKTALEKLVSFEWVTQSEGRKTNHGRVKHMELSDKGAKALHHILTGQQLEVEEVIKR